MVKKFNNELLDEVEDIINVEKPIEEEEELPVIFDGRQYSIKIPKRIAEKSNMQAGDSFRFKLKTTVDNGELKTYLVGELVHNEKKSSAQE